MDYMSWMHMSDDPSSFSYLVKPLHEEILGVDLKQGGIDDDNRGGQP